MAGWILRFLVSVHAFIQRYGRMSTQQCAGGSWVARGRGNKHQLAGSAPAEVQLSSPVRSSANCGQAPELPS